ncbi:protein IQ-DOMAIN 1 isoform X1 [Vigna radiata var. radiata]|uniref:Protein IQ-DOMAIN 1 isoform X1 n=1 Tax=Vigna radiata var. radiata TaxID=3916 RepID=A0A1S3UI59_VIGRR|nr:protein IQ-DOMAIN 1 isoform X1 [Vigna radiata var. radiata]XP_014505715.1 protein IQ-DOMAIN 1 isoform X1 [Vigna radiata var. radiata]XP_022638936.1 protein IQ-DOMAIN 1 isoform X1 [Vigna radiata var. radiata]
MGSGDWFKTIINSKKSKEGRSKKVKTKIYKGKKSSGLANGIKSKNLESAGVSIETIAATRIQTAFRAYKARKHLRRLRGFTKLRTLTQGFSVQKQASTTITHLHSWTKIQAEIRARRICMVTEDRLRRKKLHSQLKLEAKIHDLEVEWSGGSETMEKILARLHLREEAAVKRERSMAYAFSHQWRANSSQGLGNYELGKASWSWSWKDRWIAARPWESRVPSVTISPRKDQNKMSSKVKKDKKSSTSKQPVSVKTPSANDKGTKPLGNPKGTAKARRRLSYPATEKKTVQEGKQ